MSNDHYMDIQVHTNGEMSENTVMAKLFTKLHLWLVQHAQGRVGISFPHLSITPGDILRVHGSSSDLAQLTSSDWRQSAALWSSVSDVQTIPGEVQHVQVRRVQRKSAHNMRLRAMRRHGLSLAEATERIPDKQEFYSQLPYLIIRSSSTQERLSLRIQQTATSAPIAGEYSAYGFGQSGATVPWF